jgi:hypothetical protein
MTEKLDLLRKVGARGRQALRPKQSEHVLRTIHMPLTANGSSIKNSFGVVIGQMNDSATALAIVQLANATAGAGGYGDV